MSTGVATSNQNETTNGHATTAKPTDSRDGAVGSMVGLFVTRKHVGMVLLGHGIVKDRGHDTVLGPDRLIVRWTDQDGVIHHTSCGPIGEEFDVIGYAFMGGRPGDELHKPGTVFALAATMTTEARKPSIEELKNRFTHHPPKGDQTKRYETVRRHIYSTAIECVRMTPAGPEQDQALHALDHAMFLFNAAIARHE
jgi:hypothetical protein